MWDRYSRFVEHTVGGKPHREDGPAYIYDHGDFYYMLNDRVSRMDGPAEKVYAKQKYAIWGIYIQ